MTKLSGCIEMLFAEIEEFAGRISASAEAGLDAIEFWDYSSKDLDAIAAASQEAGLPVAAMCVEAPEGMDFLRAHNPDATFTTRGCPNSCSFCAVNKLEPEFYEIPDYRPAPIICDNNYTAATRKHQELVVDKQKQFTLTDFNQGLEAAEFTPTLADLLGNLKCKVRFAFNSGKVEHQGKNNTDCAENNIGGPPGAKEQNTTCSGERCQKESHIAENPRRNTAQPTKRAPEGKHIIQRLSQVRPF